MSVNLKLRKKPDPRDFEDRPFVDSLGRGYFSKPGRPRRMTPELAATIFELQVTVRASKQTIRRLLTEAGFVTKGSQLYALERNWKDRGAMLIRSAGKTGAVVPQPTRRAKANEACTSG